MGLVAAHGTPRPDSTGREGHFVTPVCKATVALSWTYDLQVALVCPVSFKRNQPNSDEISACVGGARILVSRVLLFRRPNQVNVSVTPFIRLEMVYEIDLEGLSRGVGVVADSTVRTAW